MVEKLYCNICDQCRKVLDYEQIMKPIVIRGKKRQYHYCSMKCCQEHSEEREDEERRTEGW